MLLSCSLSVECVGIYFLLLFFLSNSLLSDGFKFLCFVYLIFIPLTSAHGMISSFHILILLLRDFSLSLWVYALWSTIVSSGVTGEVFFTAKSLRLVSVIISPDCTPRDLSK